MNDVKRGLDGNNPAAAPGFLSAAASAWEASQDPLTRLGPPWSSALCTVRWCPHPFLPPPDSEPLTLDLGRYH